MTRSLIPLLSALCLLNVPLHSNDLPNPTVENVVDRVIAICHQHDRSDLSITQLIISSNHVCLIGEAKNRGVANALKRKLEEIYGSDHAWIKEPFRMAPDGSVTFRIADYPEFLNPSENGREPRSASRPNLTDEDVPRYRAAQVHRALAQANRNDRTQSVGIRQLESTPERLLLKFQAANRQDANQFLKTLREGLPDQEVRNPPFKMDRSGKVSGEFTIRAKAASTTPRQLQP